jgi:hypothetical protein
MPETFRHRGKKVKKVKKKVKKNISNVLEMSEMDNAKGIFEKSSADQNDKHEFKIFQSYALKYKKRMYRISMLDIISAVKSTSFITEKFVINSSEILT